VEIFRSSRDRFARLRAGRAHPSISSWWMPSSSGLGLRGYAVARAAPRGRSVVVLEASDGVGGRARTDP
jgi:hypothetical protein